MKYVLGPKGGARRLFTRPERVLWLFDFDGTLSPIVRLRKGAALRTGVKRLLRQMVRRFPGHVGVLSGRPLAALRNNIGLPKLLYGAVHGYEMQGPRWRWVFQDPGRVRRLKRFAARWRPALRAIPGLRLEDKKWTICVHFGEVKRKNQRKAKRLVRAMCREATAWGFKPQVAINSVEILCSTHWDKGHGARWLQKRAGCSEVFYAGDDGTDESVFKTLNSGEVGVHVGPSSSTRAKYFIRRRPEMNRLLEEILRP